MRRRSTRAKTASSLFVLGALAKRAPGSEEGLGATTRNPLITAGSLLFYLYGIIAVVLAIPGILYIWSTGQLPGFFGIRFWGDALFETTWGIQGVMIFLIPWAVLGALEILVGVWLWRSLRIGGLLALALTPVAAIFLVGYGDPFGFVVVPLRLVLVILAWKSLS